MQLDKFVQKNGLNIHKYHFKGFCKYINKETIYLLFLEDNKKNKSFLQININDDNSGIYKLIKSNKDFPEILNDDKKIIFNEFYKPIGCIRSTFTLNTKNNKIILTSDFIDIIEDNNKVSILLHEENRYIKISEKTFIKTLNKKIWVPDKIIVHNGKMHADDIFTVALARYINPNIKVIRTREIPENFDGIVADVGNSRYDHHDEKILRTNKNTGETYIDDFGNPKTYAAFGLLARDILPELIGEKSYYTIDHQFISSLDNADNFGTFNDACYLFELFNPTWNSDDSCDEKFEEAVEIALVFLKNLIEREKARVEAVPYVKNALKQMKNNILILDKRAPWQGLAKHSEALLAIYPIDNGYAVQAVQSNTSDARTNNTKILLPKEWLTEKIDGLTFCHSELYFAVFDTKENAIKNAKEFIESLEDFDF